MLSNKLKTGIQQFIPPTISVSLEIKYSQGNLEMYYIRSGFLQHSKHLDGREIFIQSPMNLQMKTFKVLT